MDGRLYGAQFALVIEFYLRCCGDHIEELNKISNSMSKIGLLYEKVSRKVTLDEVRFRPSSHTVDRALNQPKSQNNIFPQIFVSQIFRSTSSRVVEVRIQNGVKLYWHF